MSREEAITNLNMISVAFVEPVTKEQRKLIDDMVEMAIQALSQEPCTDAVSREAVIKLFRGNIGSESALILHMVKQLPSVNPQPCEDAVSRDAVIAWFCNQRCGCGCVARKSCPILVGIRELPSVTQKSGKWILTDDDFVYCSECEDSYYPRPIDASWYYCPHCGARMVEPQEGSDKE